MDDTNGGYVMSDETSASAAPPATAVRAEILAQHDELRGALRHALRLAERVMSGDRLAVASMVSFCRELHAKLEAHMCFEEAVFLPLLETVDPDRPVHAQTMVAEHARQRRELSALSALPECEADPRAAAFALQTLIADLLSDMTFEENALLGPEILQDAMIWTDQATD